MKIISYIFLLLFLVSCTNNFEEYVPLPIIDTNFQTQKIEELELEIPNHLKYTQLDIGDCEIFKDTTFDFTIVTFQNLDTLFYSNARSFYSIPKYPDSLYNFVSISYTPIFNLPDFNRLDTTFLNNEINSIIRETKIAYNHNFIKLKLTYEFYKEFTVIIDETHPISRYIQKRYYFFDNRIYRISYVVLHHGNSIYYEDYKIEADKILNSVRFFNK